MPTTQTTKDGTTIIFNGAVADRASYSYQRPDGTTGTLWGNTGHGWPGPVFLEVGTFGEIATRVEDPTRFGQLFGFAWIANFLADRTVTSMMETENTK